MSSLRDFYVFPNSLVMGPGIVRVGGSHLVGVNEASATLAVTVSATLWTPAEITTALWLDAADSTTITLNGSTVSEWRDRSGNARHAVQATASKQPTNGGDFNGINALSFDGGDALETAELFDSPSSVGMMFAAVDHSSGTNRTIMSTRQSSATNGWTWRINSSSEITYFHTGYAPSVTATRNGGKNILGIVRNELSVVHSVDGSIGSASSISGYATSGYNKTAIGAENSGTTSYFLGLIGEVVVVSGSVDTTTRQKIEGYLAHKWGLSANLPSDHPYKSTPPTI